MSRLMWDGRQLSAVMRLLSSWAFTSWFQWRHQLSRQAGTLRDLLGIIPTQAWLTTLASLEPTRMSRASPGALFRKRVQHDPISPWSWQQQRQYWKCNWLFERMDTPIKGRTSWFRLGPVRHTHPTVESAGRLANSQEPGWWTITATGTTLCRTRANMSSCPMTRPTSQSVRRKSSSFNKLIIRNSPNQENILYWSSSKIYAKILFHRSII